MLNNLHKLKDFDDYYINEMGEIFRLIKINPCDTVYGYHEVALRKDNKQIRRKTHRLVAEVFIKNPNNYDIVHHKDGNKMNNHKDNLEWVKNEEHVRNHNGKQVVINGTTYKSMREAERTTGIPRQRMEQYVIEKKYEGEENDENTVQKECC